MIKRLLTLGLIFCLTACSGPQTQQLSEVVQKTEYLKEKVIAEDGYRLPIRQFIPKKPKGVVIALHGFNDYSKAFEGMCHFLVEQDYACIAYDQRGFGETEYKGIWLASKRLQKDLITVIHLVKKHLNVPIYVAGESMGGAVIITSASDYPEEFIMNVSGLILLAPAVWARSTQPWYQRWLLWMGVHTVPGWTPTGEGLGVQATDNIEALREMGRDENVIKATRIDTIYGLTNLMDDALNDSPNLPINVFALYGDKDEVIPKEPICIMLDQMSRNVSGIRFKHYKKGYHMLTRDLQAKKVFEDVLSWMSGQLIKDETAITTFCH